MPERLIAFSRQPGRIETAEGDIAAQQADAVVNAANNLFWMGSGVAGALKARGGADIEAEAMAFGPVEPGECDARGCASIAFPALGTGVGGFPLAECARIMIGAVRARQMQSLELLGTPLEGPADCPISG